MKVAPFVIAGTGRPPGPLAVAITRSDLSFPRRSHFLIGARRNFFCDFFLRRRRRRAFSKPRSVLFACFNVAEHRAHGICLLQLHCDPVDLAFARRSHAHDRFVRLDVDDFLIVHNFVARFDLDIDDCGFGD